MVKLSNQAWWEYRNHNRAMQSTAEPLQSNLVNVVAIIVNS